MFQFIQGISRTLLRLAFVLAGLVLAGLLLLVGLSAALGLLLWNRLRGRRSPTFFGAPGQRSWGRMRKGSAAPASPGRAADPEVIDVEMREVPDVRGPSHAVRHE